MTQIHAVTIHILKRVLSSVDDIHSIWLITCLIVCIIKTIDSTIRNLSEYSKGKVTPNQGSNRNSEAASSSFNHSLQADINNRKLSSSDSSSGQDTGTKPKKKLFFTLADVDQLYLMDLWTNQVLFARIYENEKNIFLNQNYIVNDPLMYLIVRRIKAHKNQWASTSDAFQTYISSTYYDTNVLLGDEIDSQQINLGDGETIYFTAESDKYTINNYGGYYIPYSRDKDESLSYDYLSDIELMKPGWVNAIFMFVYVNRNNQITVINQVSFTQKATGEIIGSYKADSFPEFYIDSVDYFRAILECLFIIMTAYFLK